MGLSDVRRRQFLASVGTGALAAMVDGRPVQINEATIHDADKQIVRYRMTDRRDGSAPVIVPSTRTAYQLTRTLETTSERHPLYRQLARVTADAAGLAGWVALDQVDIRPALGWFSIAVDAGNQAGSFDRIALTMEDQARTLHALGRIDAAIGLLYCAPVTRTLPATRAIVEMRRALLLARGQQVPQAHRALERASTAVDEARDGPPPPGRWPVSPARLMLHRGRTYAHLGLGAPAYELLVAARKEQPKELVRGTGSLVLDMARAALQMGEIDLAAHHATEAAKIFIATKSSHRLTMVTRFRQVDLAGHHNLQAVRELDEQLAPHRYVRVRAEYGAPWRLHEATCSQLKRRHLVNAEPWPDGDGREPRDLAADPVVRDQHDPCRSCIGRLW